MREGIFDESVVGDEAELAVFNVRDAVERVHQEAVRTFVERDRHGIGGEVPAAEIVEDSRRPGYGLAGLGESH